MTTSGPIQSGWRRWLGLPSRTPSQVSSDVDAELAFHLAMREEELRLRGLDPATASTEARRRFGDVTQATQFLRSADLQRERHSRIQRWAADLRHDVVYAARRLTREPGFAATAILTLALGIGSTVAMTSVLRRMILAPLPYEGAERLVSMQLKSKDGSIRVSGNPEVLDAWRTGIPSLERVESMAGALLTTERGGQTQRVNVGMVSPGLLEYLHVIPVLGRGFVAGEAVKGAAPVAMLAWNTWTRHYASDPTVVGRSLMLGNISYTIVGVMPRFFDPSVFGLMPRSEYWSPHVPSSDHGYTVALGVLRPGASLDGLTSELSLALDRVPKRGGMGTLVPSVVKLLDTAGDNTRTSLYLMAAAVAMVLLIACINVANLLLARGAAREREMAVRGAIGAARTRLVRQLLTESVLLSMIGAAVGVVLARGMLQLVTRYRPVSFAALDDVHIDATMVWVAGGTAVLTALLFGLAPAMLTSATRGGLLQGGQRNVGTGHAGRQARRLLVFAEVACSMTLVVTALLLVRSAQGLDRMRLGYDVDPLVVMRVQQLTTRADSTPLATLLAPAMQRVRALPGVVSASVTDNWPGGFGGCLCELLAEGAPVPPEERASFMVQVDVDSTYLRTAGTRMLAGRGPVQDTVLREAAVTSALASRLWPGLDPIGKRFRLNRDAPYHTVVGVVEMQLSPEGWAPADSSQVVLGREAHGDAVSVTIRMAEAITPATVRAISDELQRLAPGLLVLDPRRFADHVAEARAPQRFTRLLLGSFAACALVLAALGLYGVMAYGVTQRTREIGVRMALGAPRAAIARLVAREGLVLTTAGLVAGGAGSIALTQLVGDMLNGVSRWDALAFAGAAAVMLAVALAALWLPVRRATRVDPVTAVSAD